MTLEEQLKQEIIRQHGSVLAFSKASGIKNSTIDSMLTRGLYNAGVGRVMQIFELLGIDTESLAVGRLIYADRPETAKTPTPSGEDAGALSKADVESALVSLGIVQEGQHISDADLRFMDGVINLIDVWFQNRHQ